MIFTDVWGLAPMLVELEVGIMLGIFVVWEV